jgi:hypothetical protein
MTRYQHAKGIAAKSGKRRLSEAHTPVETEEKSDAGGQQRVEQRLSQKRHTKFRWHHHWQTKACGNRKNAGAENWQYGADPAWPGRLR